MSARRFKHDPTRADVGALVGVISQNGGYRGNSIPIALLSSGLAAGLEALRVRIMTGAGLHSV